MLFHYNKVEHDVDYLCHRLSKSLSDRERILMKEWCKEHFEDGEWKCRTEDYYDLRRNEGQTSFTTFYFPDQNAAAEFRLRWE